MYTTREIRWFFVKDNTSIRSWFADKGFSFESADARTDHYLFLPDIHNLNVKLREGQIEIKQKTIVSKEYALGSQATGYLEEWKKWSLALDNKDTLSKSIMGHEYSQWIAVHKERMGLILRQDEDQQLHYHDISADLPSGCQIEYTRVRTNEQTWFTFGLEWFGESTQNLPEELLSEILGESKLDQQDSMSYATFLSEIK
jgi:hypothetical protein